MFIDGRRATYLREEITPRKLGVARYAQRRHAAWEQLHPCIVLDTLVGSGAWGVAEEGSDEDRRGVFVLPAPCTTGLAEPPLDLVSLDAAAERLADSANIKAPSRSDAVIRARDYIKQLYRSMYDQGLIAANDWASLRAAATTQLELPRDLRPKNAYNLIRWLDLAIRWLAGEPPDVQASDAIRPTLLAIKRGEVAMADVMALARELTPRLEAARQASKLPSHPDIGRAEQVLRDARDEAARRWLAHAPGPWGADAPRAPEATFDD